jgi:hypothetical protein
LAFGRSQHPDADLFTRIIDHEVKQLLKDRPDVLVWDDFSTLAAKISQQVIFGHGKYCPYFEQRVSRIVSSSNWGIARHHDLRPFFNRIRTQLDEKASPRSVHLARRAARWGTKNGNRKHAQVSSQVAFWAFVMKDAIELHTVRTLALIVQAPDVQRRLIEEVRASRPPTAADIDGLDFLEACIKEQLRLWTPVPILLRKAVEDFELPADAAGTAPKVAIPKGHWILMHTGFYHRDPEVFGAAAHRFSPEERVHDRCNAISVTNSDPPLYVFSRHHQACAGQFLAIFLLKAVLAALLRRGPYVLLDDKIDREAVPSAIDQFALRFLRRRREPCANPLAGVP